MSKAVLISINPKWCAMIASGEKKVEIRKNRPQIKPPFKCYIYCTKGRRLGIINISNDVYEANGSVVGEFVCDRVVTLPYGQSYDEENVCIWIYTGARMKAKELYDYAKGKTVYGWHISDLKIYDTPKELGEFTPFCRYIVDDGECDIRIDCYHQRIDYNPDGRVNVCRCGKKLSKAPQSWCYVSN